MLDPLSSAEELSLKQIKELKHYLITIVVTVSFIWTWMVEISFHVRCLFKVFTAKNQAENSLWIFPFLNFLTDSAGKSPIHL